MGEKRASNEFAKSFRCTGCERVILKRDPEHECKPPTEEVEPRPDLVTAISKVLYT